MPATRKPKVTIRRAATSTSLDRRRSTGARTSQAKKETPRSRKPEGVTLEGWQVAPRREFGREQKYKLENLGDQPIFSEFRVTNPETGGRCRVTVRGRNRGDNHCTCPDFAINTLATCKHIEFTLGRLERWSGGKQALAKGFQPEHSDVYLGYDAKRDVVFRHGTTCPVGVRRLAARCFGQDGKLKADCYEKSPTFLKKANTNGHRVTCHEDVLSFVAQVRDQASIRRRVDATYRGGVNDTSLKRLLKAPLYPYQRQGALFAARAGRCLIADEMGFGKTIQAIAAAEILAQLGAVERVLIVCPTSLKYQWKEEISKFSNREATIIEGPVVDRWATYRGDGFYKITNYDVVHRDLDNIQGYAPDLIILDEAQRIKNWKTRTAQSVKKLASPYAIVLTGTPLENRLEELHSIIEFVDRFRLGPAFRFLAGHQHVDETGRVIGYRNLSTISKTLEPILVRRTKQQVLKDLPERLEKKFFVPMTDPQRTAHDDNGEIVAKIVVK